MNVDTMLVFNVRGSYGHFRKPYTTTSPLTYPFPPRPALCGFIGAILGTERKEFNTLFSPENCTLGLRIISKVVKIKIAINYLDIDTPKTFHAIKGRKQIPVEFLKSPHFTIYFSHKEKSVHQKMKHYLEQHETEFTPCLGLSQLLADFEYKGEYPFKFVSPNNGESVEIQSVIPVSESVQVVFDDMAGSKEYFSCRLPRIIEEKTAFKRKTLEYMNIVFERRCQSILCRSESHIEIQMPQIERIIAL